MGPENCPDYPPHVSLAGTYLRNGSPTPNSEAEEIQRLSSLYQSVEPFEITLNGIRAFPPEDQPVIFLGVEPSPGWMSARQVLQEMLGQDKHTHFIPHLTLAMRLQGESARKALNTLKTSEWATKRHSFQVTELRLMRRSKTDATWRCVATFPLTGNGHPKMCDEPIPQE